VVRNSIVSTVLILCSLFAGPVEAVKPILWREHTQAQFSKGEPDGVSLTREGVVALSPAVLEAGDVGEQFIWDLALDHKGRLLIATGNSGKVFELTQGTTPKLLLDTPEVAIFSIAVSQDGTVFAGSSPDGLIYRIRPGKEAETFCRTGDEHVWALVADGSVVYAATGGGSGRVLKISDDGNAEELFRSSDPNLVCLIRGSDGSLYAGSDQSGLVYRMKAGGPLEVLYDAPESEIHALAMGSGGLLYAGAMSGRVSTGETREKPSPSQGNGPTPSAEKSTVYAIRPSGATLRLWEVTDPTLLAIQEVSPGEIVVLTGETGGVYRVKSDGSATLLTRLKDAQPWTFVTSPGGDLWVGTAGSGKIYKLGQSVEASGTLTSVARDFSLVSRWGKLSWKGELAEGTSISFQTRSGNSEVPDDTWSSWSTRLTSPEGSQISSPPGRFIQYRAHLKSSAGGASPSLREVNLSGLQENVSPQILTIGVNPLGGKKDGPINGNDKSKGRHNGSEGGKGVWKISWVAADVNNDRLVYDLYFRGRDERQWKLLENELTKSSFLWNIESAPEGMMQVKVVASDRLSNPERIALRTEKESEPFDLDHTPPMVVLQVQAEGSGTLSVEGTIKDATSALREAAYALNSGKWKVLFPSDDIFDSLSESFSFKVHDLKAGEYTLVVRASDALGNVGVSKAVAEVE
jgi:hypothetical protein